MASLSENNINVTYDGIAPWAVVGHNNAPYVAMSFDPVMAGGLWANTRTITLNGSVSEGIVGNLETIKNNIINTFSANGKIFEFSDSYGTTKTFNDVFVDSINFPQANYVGKLDYSITLRVYDFQYDEVLDPVDQVEAQANPNGSIGLSRTVSARGVGWNSVNNSTGIDHAKDWVDSRIANALYNPCTITGYATNLNYIVLEDSEAYNRLTGTYSRTLKYLADEGVLGVGDGGSCAEEFTFTRFHTLVSQGITEESTKVSITAEITGGSNTAINHFRSGGTNNANWTESFLKTSAETASSISLCGPPNNLTIDEDLNSKKVTIKADFDTHQCFCSSDYHFDHEVSVNTSYVTGVTKVDVNGEIKVKGGRAKRNDVIDNFVTGTNIETFLSGIASGAYSDSNVANMQHPVAGGVSLNNQAESVQITRSQSKGTLRISASFNDEDHLSGFSQADWQVNIKGSVPYAKTHPSATENGYWSIQYFGFTSREKVSVSANVSSRQDPASTPGNTRAQASNLMTNALATYTPVAGTFYTVSESETSKEDTTDSASVSREVSYPGSMPLISLGVGPPPF